MGSHEYMFGKPEKSSVGTWKCFQMKMVSLWMDLKLFGVLDIQMMMKGSTCKSILCPLCYMKSADNKKYCCGCHDKKVVHTLYDGPTFEEMKAKIAKHFKEHLVQHMSYLELKEYYAKLLEKASSLSLTPLSRMASHIRFFWLMAALCDEG